MVTQDSEKNRFGTREPNTFFGGSQFLNPKWVTKVTSWHLLGMVPMGKIKRSLKVQKLSTKIKPKASLTMFT